VFGGLNRLLATAVIAGAVLVVPPVASAGCNGGVSAVNVYKECVPTGGGGKATSHGTGTHTNTGASSSTPVHISPRTAKALKKAGQDGKPLLALVKGYGALRLLQSHSTGASNEPTAIGSAFDLGSGPTLLLIVLGATAALLLGATGFRVARHRRD
jgi:UPF0716 family protein affecting phage T7 exclusion